MKTNRSNKAVHRVLAAGFALAFAAVVMPVGAEEDAEGTPEEQEKDCGVAVKTCDTTAVTDAYSAMRQECQAFRQCKRGCGDEKRDCKTSARLAKRDCKDVCKSKSGKAKRDCKSACAKEKKAAKQACRKAKRDCNSGCRDEFKDQGCVKARNDFWGSLIGKGKDCAVDVKENCESPFPKK